jgi:hypothetical protein
MSPNVCSLRIHFIQSGPVGEGNIPGDHGIGHSKQKCVYVRVSYSERFLR